MRERAARLSGAASLISLVFVSPLAAQAGLPLLGDASIPAPGTFRLHAATAWTRYDARYASTGVTPLGSFLTSDSLGARQLPQLAVAESLAREASGVPFTLTMGRSRLDATAREEIIPIALEFGVARRLAVGVMMPIVRKRVAPQFRLDTLGGYAANVGPNQHRTSPAAALNNSAVQAQFASAAQQLQTRLASCQANPTGAGCAALLARQAEAQALLAASAEFADLLAQLYGSDASAGQPFIPTAVSDAHLAVQSRIGAFNLQYRDLLTATTDLLTVIPFGAGGPAGVADLRTYFASEEGSRDSIAMQERVGIGDVELGVRAMLIDRPATEQEPLGVRLLVSGAYRFSTGSTQSPSEIADMRIGTGLDAVQARAIMDLEHGRLGVLASGRFETALAVAEPAVLFDSLTPRSDKRVTEVSVAPRWHMSRPLAFHLAYVYRSGDISGSEQLAGGGVGFSGFSLTPPGRTPPVEMRYTHLQSISGDAGRPKFARDQIELRIYYRLRR